MRDLARLGAGAISLLALLFVGTLGLWVGVPLAWLWIGSQIQHATDNVGAAIGAMIVGVLLTIVLLMLVLARLTRAYQRSRVARGLDDTGSFPLEVTLTVSAAVGVVATIVWFVLFADSAPLPVPSP